MTNRHLSILLLILLIGGIVLAAGVLVVGPRSVEDQTVELYEANQKLMAEQGAVRIWETLRDVEVRLATSVSHQWAWLKEAQSTQDLKSALARLSHHSDPKFGITLAVLDQRGRMLAVEPAAPLERIEVLESHVHAIPKGPTPTSLVSCQRCLSEHHSLLIATDIDEERVLAASIDLEQLASRVFEQVSRSRSTYAALLDASGTVIHARGSEQERSQGRWVVGQAAVPDTGLSLEIAAPRSVVAPEVHDHVRGLLYTTYGVLIFLLACIAVLAVLKRREHLEHLARTRSLAHQDKLATLGMMAASTAHEIRNAIAVAKLQLQLATMIDDVPEKNAHLEKAAGSVDRLAGLAENLSGYAGKDQMTSNRFEIGDVIDEALSVVQPRVGSGVDIEVHREDDLSVFGSRTALVQVVVNLVLNALDAVASREGEGAWIEVETRRDADDAVISVTDNGDGIDPSVMDSIFNPFFSTKDNDTDVGGTGIGLWLCSQIIKQHSGTIDAMNVDSGGASFVVRIPIDRRASVDGDTAMRESA